MFKQRLKSNEIARQFATYFVIHKITSQAHMDERWSENRAQVEYYDTVRPTQHVT